jgi:ABC-type amino acid transport substrate-binding protein
MNFKYIAVLAATAVAVAGLACNAHAQERQAAPADAKAYIVAPQKAAKVKSPVTIVFGLKGMGIAPAGIKMDNTGHHHLLINTEVPADLSTPLPATEQIVHFGKGQTEVTLNLKPGKYTVQLLLGDYLHIPHNPPVVSEKLTFYVVK